MDTRAIWRLGFGVAALSVVAAALGGGGEPTPAAAPGCAVQQALRSPAGPAPVAGRERVSRPRDTGVDGQAVAAPAHRGIPDADRVSRTLR